MLHRLRRNADADGATEMSVFSMADFDGHEFVHAFFDRKTRLKGFVAVHSTALGPAFGGCRMWPYADDQGALRDALRLSLGMSLKNAMANLPYGGGKAVIIGDPRHDKTPELFEAFGRIIESLAGRYITAEDVGVDVDDMRAIERSTNYVGGIPQAEGYRGGDPSPRTALGVLQGLKAAVSARLGTDSLTGLTVAVQGAGSVGYELCKLLHEAGARLLVADINAENVARCVDELGATAVDPDGILVAEADVLAPCALGGVLNERTIPELKCSVVAGAANNQLATVADGDRLQARDILYAPDYVINAGGIISVAAERDPDADADRVRARIMAIGERTAEVLQASRRTGTPPHQVADELAREIIREAEAGQGSAAA